MMIHNWIKFGQVSAEKDANLINYFYENGVLDRVVKDESQFLVLGRKGAGKTAVFQQFSNNATKYVHNEDQIESFSLQNYNWDVHALLQTSGKALALSYIQSWKYVIYLAAVKKLAERPSACKEIKKAKKVIDRIYSSPAPSLAEMLGSRFMSLSKLTLPSANLGEEDLQVSLGEVTFDQVKADSNLQSVLNSSVGRLVDFLEDAISKQTEIAGRIFICFDRVDEAWDVSSFEDSKKIISGLIAACETINGKFNKLVRPIVFLREDIFESISLNDKNKLRTDCGQLLAWDSESLQRMILERINYYAREANQTGFTQISDVFDKAQMRQQRKPFDYMLMRTFSRPRDVIRIFELVRGDMESRASNPYDPTEVNSVRLECKSIYNAEAAYSEWFLEELKDEWSVQRPSINLVFDALQHNAKAVFSKAELSASLVAVGYSVDDLQLMKELRFLFENSVIGLRVGKSQQWRFKCFFKTQGFLDSDVYKVHDGLLRALNLTEKRGSEAAIDSTEGENERE